MRRYLRGFAILLALLPALALAQGPPSSIYSGKVASLGYCQITALTTAVQLVSASCSTGSVPSVANFVVLTVEAQAIRYRTDGTAPTTTLGVPVAVGSTVALALVNLSAIRLIGQVSGAIVNADFYQ